jgi:hypothetical protein
LHRPGLQNRIYEYTPQVLSLFSLAALRRNHLDQISNVGHAVEFTCSISLPRPTNTGVDIVRVAVNYLFNFGFAAVSDVPTIKLKSYANSAERKCALDP